MSTTKEEFLASLKKSGLSQGEFAELVGVAKGTVSTWGATNAKNGRPVPKWAMVLLKYRALIMAREILAEDARRAEEYRLIQEYEDKNNADYERHMAPIWAAQEKEHDDKIERFKASLSPAEREAFEKSEADKHEARKIEAKTIDFSKPLPAKK